MTTNRIVWLLGGIGLAALLLITHAWSHGTWTPFVLWADMMVAGVAAFLFAQRHLQGETFLMEKFGWPGFLRWLGGSLVCICLVSGLRWLWQGDPFDWKSALSVLEGFMLAYLIVTPIRIAFLNLVNG